MIIHSIEQFRLNMQSVKNLHSIVDAINISTPALDLSEILRAEIVLSVSALDCFLHDLIRLGTLEIYQGTRRYDHSKAEAPKFDIARLLYLLTKSKAEQITELDRAFRNIFSTKTLQNVDVIHSNLLCINVNNVWQDVAQAMHLQKIDVEQRLGLIITRRNCISHEADIDPSGGIGQKNTIIKTDVWNDINFISAICEQIYIIATNAM